MALLRELEAAGTAAAYSDTVLDSGLEHHEAVVRWADGILARLRDAEV